VSPYVRKVPTASGATAVQIVEKRNGRRRIVEHIGSARDETELAALMSAAQQRVNGCPGRHAAVRGIATGRVESGGGAHG